MFGIVVVAALVMGVCPQADPRPLGEVRGGVHQRLTSDRLQDARREPDAPAHLFPAAAPALRPRRLPAADPSPVPPPAGAHAMNFDATQLLAYPPMLILIGMGCVVLLAETFVQRQRRAAVWPGWGSPAASPRWRRWCRSGRTPPSRPTHFEGMLVVDRMALYLDAAFIAAAL